VRRRFAIFLVAAFASMFVVAYSQEVTVGGGGSDGGTTVEQPDSKVTLSSLRLNPSEVRAGETVKVTVTLSAPAPAAGVVVKLSSSNPQVADVDPRVTIDKKNRSTTLIISTSPTSASSNSILPVSYPFALAFAQSASTCQYGGEPSCSGGECVDENANGICDDEEASPKTTTPGYDCADENANGICDSEEGSTQSSGQAPEQSTQPSGQAPKESIQPPGQAPKESTQPPKGRSRKQTVDLTITASLKSVERSKTLKVIGVQTKPA
jgi:hypothetical protein